MRITLSPQLRDDELVVIKTGDILTINGEAYDFTGLPEGASVENIPCEYIVGPVSREAGSIEIKLLLPCSIDSPQERNFPSPIINPPDGRIIFPGDGA